MIDPAICRGCDFWRKSSCGTFMCNYCVDVDGPSRTTQGQLLVCNVRQVGGKVRPRIRSHKYDTAERKPKAGVRYMELYRKGLTDRQISEATGASIFAVANWRQRNKMPPNKAVKPVKIPEEKTGDPCQRCYSAEVCQRVGGTCNEKEVDGVKVLVACEESQEVCKAFRELGHEAYSCDIEPCSGGHPEWHLQVDALELLKIKWDLIIAHPPCTYMTNAGAVRMRVNGEESVMRTNEARLAWNTRAPILSTEEMEMLDAKD